MFYCSDDVVVPDAKEKEKFFDEMRSAVGNTIADCLPPIINHHSEALPDTFADSFLSLDHLVELRRAHDTNLARKAVRTAKTRAETEDITYRRELIKKICEVLNEKEVMRPSTGLARTTRWMGTGQVAAGNAANAAAVAATRSAQVRFSLVFFLTSLIIALFQAVSMRSALYARYHLPRTLQQLASNAGIEPTSPLKEGSFGVVYIHGRLFVAQGV